MPLLFDLREDPRFHQCSTADHDACDTQGNMDLIGQYDKLLICTDVLTAERYHALVLCLIM